MLAHLAALKTARNFLKHKKGLGLLHIYDPMHRRQNDVLLSMADAGLLRRVCMNLSLYNIKYGPWLKGGWFRMLQETAHQLRDMPRNDPLLLKFWPDILKDRGFLLEDSQTGRDHFLKTLRSQQFLTSKGPVAATAKFNSIASAHRLIDSHWSSQAFVMTATCMVQGWVQFADRLWCPDGTVDKEADEGLSRSKAKRQAKEKLEQLRSRAVNSLHAMTKYMNDDCIKSESRIIAAVLEPESAAASKMLQEMRGSGKTLEYLVSWAHGGWLDTAKSHLQLLTDTHALDRIGLCMACDKDCQPGEVDWDLAMATKLWKLTLSIFNFRAGSNLWHTWGPGASAGLLGETEEKVCFSLQWPRDLFGAVLAVKENGSHAAQALLQHSMCEEVWIKHVFHWLAQANFREVPEGLDSLLRKVWGGLLNSKLVEDANKFQRQHEDRSNNAKTLPLGETWHCVSQHEVLKAYERQEVKARKQYNVPADFDIEGMCRPHADRTRQKTPEEQADFEFVQGVTGTQTWPAFTPESEQRIFCRLALLVHLNKRGQQWELAEKAWMSGLLPPGIVFLYRS